LFGQHGGKIIFMSRGFPNIRAQSLLVTGSGIRQIKDVFQLWRSAGVVDQGNAGCPAAHHPMHPPVPEFNRRAGRRFRVLCVNQNLVPKGVLVEPDRTGEKIGPALHGVGYLQSCPGCQVRDDFVIVQ
jgi:hypothetical protein